MDIKDLEDNDQYGLEAFEKGFYSALQRQLPPSLDQLHVLIEERHNRLMTKNRLMASDPLRQMHVRMTCLVVAAFEIVQLSYDRKQSIKLVEAAFLGSLGDKVTTGTKALLDSVADPFQEMVAVSKQREDYFFGDSFQFERPVDNDRAYLLDITGCFYHRLLVANGAADLTPSFCAFDGNWIKAIDQNTHNFRFERPTTIGWGHDRCRFYFFRAVEKDK